MRQIEYDIRVLYAILGGKISYALNHKFLNNFKLYRMSITPEEWMILTCLWEREGLTQQEISNATLRDKHSLSRLIDTMVEEGLIRREGDTTDLRIRRIYLTEKGKNIEGKAKFVADKTLNEMLKGVSQEELHACQETLRIIFNNSKV